MLSLPDVRATPALMTQCSRRCWKELKEPDFCSLWQAVWVDGRAPKLSKVIVWIYHLHAE